MILSYSRGHRIIFINNEWVYEDTREPISVKRACIRCGQMPTKEGYDACLDKLVGVKSACCGHGVHEGYVIK